jgi:hypothetical protein
MSYQDLYEQKEQCHEGGPYTKYTSQASQRSIRENHLVEQFYAQNSIETASLVT